MSKVIRNDHLWTDEEVEYQLARNLATQVEQNRTLYGEGGDLEGQNHSEPNPDEVVLHLAQDIPDHVKNLSLEQAQEELRSKGLQPKGDEVAVKVALAERLQAERDASNSNG